MRISDWSSDVCSSDLPPRNRLSSFRPRPAFARGGGFCAVPMQRLPSPPPPPNLGPKCTSATMRAREQTGQNSHAANGSAIRATAAAQGSGGDGRKQGRSEEHTSELQSLMRISYAVFCLKKKNNTK